MERLLAVSLACAGTLAAQSPTPPIDVGDRLEPFVDRHLIEGLDGAELRLAEPRPAGTVLTLDRPWEGIVSGYFTVLRDARTGRYHMYYRGWPDPDADGKFAAEESVTCYAESADGIAWRRPELGLFEVEGTRANNVILVEPHEATHNFAPFLDTRPGVPDAERFKALGGTARSGLFAFVSADGVAWRRLREEAVLHGGAFDSQNVSFWSVSEGCYVCLYRTMRHGVRWVTRVTSDDFVTWSEPVDIDFGDAPYEHLYTSQTHPYFRAPHVLVALAARFWPGRRALTEEQIRATGLDRPPNYPGLPSNVSDVVFMTSRGGNRFERTFLQSFVRPGLDPRDWVGRTNYAACGVVPTGPGEMSLYVQRHYGQPTHHLERLTLRTDGFASVHADRTGELLTRPLRFAPLDAEERGRRVAALEAGGVRSSAEVVADRVLGSVALEVSAPTSFALPGTAQLGTAVTLAARVRDVPGGHRRLFSAYDGRSTAPRELVFDFDSSGAIGAADGPGLRFLYDDVRVEARGRDWSAADSPHHLAATWDDGAVTLYFDGHAVGRGGSKGRGALELRLGDLRFGEDYPPTRRDNEPFLGVVDDVLVLRRCLDGEELRALADLGAASVVDPDSDDGVWLAFDGDEADAVRDSLGGETVPVPRWPANRAVRQLVVNFATSAAGSLRVEVRDADGRPIPGYAFDDCAPMIGNAIERPVVWRGTSDVSPLAGRAIRLCVRLADADLYSLRFR